MMLSFLYCSFFLLYFVPVTVNGTVFSLFLMSTVFCSCLFRFCFSIVFLLFSCQLLLSFFCLVLFFLPYFVPVTVNGKVLSLFCQSFWPLSLSFLSLDSFSPVFLSNLLLFLCTFSDFLLSFSPVRYCKWSVLSIQF